MPTHPTSKWAAKTRPGHAATSVPFSSGSSRDVLSSTMLTRSLQPPFIGKGRPHCPGSNSGLSSCSLLVRAPLVPITHQLPLLPLKPGSAHPPLQAHGWTACVSEQLLVRGSVGLSLQNTLPFPFLNMYLGGWGRRAAEIPRRVERSVLWFFKNHSG